MSGWICLWTKTHAHRLMENNVRRQRQGIAARRESVPVVRHERGERMTNKDDQTRIAARKIAKDIAAQPYGFCLRGAPDGCSCPLCQLVRFAEEAILAALARLQAENRELRETREHSLVGGDDGQSKLGQVAGAEGGTQPKDADARGDAPLSKVQPEDGRENSQGGRLHDGSHLPMVRRIVGETIDTLRADVARLQAERDELNELADRLRWSIADEHSALLLAIRRADAAEAARDEARGQAALLQRPTETP